MIHCCLIRAIIAGLAHDDKNGVPITVDGKLNLLKIGERDAALKAALNVGAVYTYVPRQVFFKYPGLDLVAQESGNYVQNVAKGEHDVQLLLKIASMLEEGRTFDFITDHVRKSNPSHLEAVPGIFHFLRKFGGKTNMEWARETAQFIRGEVDTSRKVGADMWDAFGIDLKGAEQLGRLRHAFVMLAYVDPMPNCVRPSDIKGLLKDQKQASAALAMEKIMNQVHAQLELHNTGDKFVAAVSREVAVFDMVCAATVSKKNKAACIVDVCKEFDIKDIDLNLNHVMWVLAKHVADLPNASEAMANALAKVASDNGAIKLNIRPTTSSAAGANSKVEPSVRNATLDVTTAILQECGWSIGDLVENKKDKDNQDNNDTQWEITSFNNGTVTLTSRVDHDTKDVPMCEFQQKKWTKKKDVQTIVIPATVPTLESSKQYLFNLIRSTCFIALAEAAGSQEGADKLIARVKPHRGIEVSSDIAKGQLTLAPVTERIDILEKEKVRTGFDAFNTNQLFLGSFSHESKQYFVFAAGHQSNEDTPKKPAMRSLFWGVKVTDVEADANIKLNATISGAKINVSKIHKWISNEASTKEVLTVPCIINKQALKTGNELLLFQASNKRQRTK